MRRLTLPTLLGAALLGGGLFLAVNRAARPSETGRSVDTSTSRSASNPSPARRDAPPRPLRANGRVPSPVVSVPTQDPVQAQEPDPWADAGLLLEAQLDREVSLRGNAPQSERSLQEILDQPGLLAASARPALTCGASLCRIEVDREQLGVLARGMEPLDASIPWDHDALWYPAPDDPATMVILVSQPDHRFPPENG